MYAKCAEGRRLPVVEGTDYCTSFAQEPVENSTSTIINTAVS
jgi:hypothetical protein